MPFPDPHTFRSSIEAARRDDPRTLAVPIVERLLDDQLTPVLAYRRLVAPDERTAPSFLLESVEGGERQGRHSILSAQPAFELTAREGEVAILDHLTGRHTTATSHADPLSIPRERLGHIRLIVPAGIPPLPLLGGWVGYVAYDAVRYTEPDKLPFMAAPRDDRSLPDIDLAFYDNVVVFDHVDKVVNVVQIALVAPGDDVEAAYAAAIARLERRIAALQHHSKPLACGRVGSPPPVAPLPSNITRERHAEMVARALEYIRAGDIFQVVLGQRFEHVSTADPFDVYRALRVVNPSPYMVYLQSQGCILIASSPEILCRVRRRDDNLIVTNRPLAGTRRRGATPEEDAALERELLADPKERAEHAMLVDLGRNDVGQVAVPGTIELPRIMDIERYSHVMHISSTITGTMRPGLDAWDALRAALPVGTISGAPKIRAMQIIDELEPIRRGPYGGGVGYVGLDGQMDIALTLRTIVAPTRLADAGRWTYHLQASGGIVADSQPEAEYQETVNKAAALARAINLAETAFAGGAV